jgi:hypothetical protein
MKDFRVSREDVYRIMKEINDPEKYGLVEKPRPERKTSKKIQSQIPQCLSLPPELPQNFRNARKSSKSIMTNKKGEMRNGINDMKRVVGD